MIISFRSSLVVLSFFTSTWCAAGCGSDLPGSAGGGAGIAGAAGSSTPEATGGSASGSAGAAGSIGTAAATGGAGASGSAGSADSAGAAGSSRASGNGGSGGANAAGAGAGGSSAGAGGSAGSGGSAPYDPCPTNGDACRIMPLGDSITDGCCGENTLSQRGAYRVELFHQALGHKKKVTFVGSGQSGPALVDNVVFPRKQEGHAGWVIATGGGHDGLQDRVEGWLKATPADIITLMIGTNDVQIQFDETNAPKRLGTLIDTITAAAPKALLVVAQTVPTQDDMQNVRVQAFNAAIPALVKARSGAGKHVTLVNMYSAFSAHADFKTSLLANRLHPTDAGYATMANVWWAAIGNLLPSQ